MDNLKFFRAKLIISDLIKRVPYIYLKNIYENNLLKNNITYIGSENIVSHINNLFSSNKNINIPTVIFGKNDVSSQEIIKFKNYLNNNIDNLCFRANIGSYTEELESELRINKKDIISMKNTKLLLKCYNDLNNYNQIRNSLISKINFCQIYSKYKGDGNIDKIKNYRFLFSHSLFFKILDKLLILDVIKKMNLNNSFPDKNIFINNFDNKYTSSIRDNSYIISNTNNIVLIDISKAYPSVDFDSLKILLYRSLNKRFSSSFSKSFLQKYLFLLKNRKFKYKKNNIFINKGISTGLASSSLIFTFIIEAIVDELIEILQLYDITFKKDYELKIFIDDITIIIKNKLHTKFIISTIVKILKYYKFNINESKCKISCELSYNFPKIKDGDYYLGLPFSHSVKNYLDIILIQFRKRHLDISYKDIKRIYKLKNLPYQSELSNKINGFFQYKLYGLKKYNIDNSLDNFINLINKYY
jgi:hypothetical protein